MNDPRNEQRLRQTLQEVAQRDVPATVDLRRAVRARLAGHPAPARPAVAVPWGRVALATGVLLALVLVAFGPLLGSRLLPLNATGGPTTPSASGPTVSQTVQGYTITLYPAEMDANWTVFTYTLRSPAGAPVGIVPGRWITGTYAGPRVMTEQGTELGFIGTLFPQIYNTDVNLWGTSLDEAELVFRTDALGDSPVRHLHLELNLAKILPESATLSVPWWQLQTTPVAGPFAFDVAVPVNRQARIADIGQTVTAGQAALTLERVLVTATETRIFLRPDSPDLNPGASLGPGNYEADATLRVGDWSSQMHDGLGRMGWDGTYWVYTYIDVPLLDKVGDWTLTVVDTPLSHPGTPRGPWIFHFTVPPLGTS